MIDLENPELTLDLDEMIEILHEIYLGKDRFINLPKYLMTLALEIREIKKILEKK